MNKRSGIDLSTNRWKKQKTSELNMDKDLQSNMEIAKSSRILRLFIGFVKSERKQFVETTVDDCIRLLDWLSLEKIDVNNQDWDRDEKIQRQYPRKDYEKHESPLVWCSSLKKMLPILLKCNDNFKFQDEKGKTILHYFLESNVSNYHMLLLDPKYVMFVVSYLMKNGLSVEVADKDGNTPLHIAAKLMSIDLMEMMLETCTNINICNNEGDTILHIMADNAIDNEDAPRKDMTMLARLIIYEGADINLQNKKGWTPLFFAAKHNHMYLLKLFLRKGANLKLLAKGGENALLLSCKHSNSGQDARFADTSIQLLMDGGSDVNATDENGYSSLHYTSSHGYMSYVELLLQAGAKVHSKTKDYSFTPLHSACQLGHNASIIKLLVEAGAEVNAVASDNVTPLHLLARRGGIHAFKYLIEKGANVHCRENLFGFTLLHMAALGIEKEVLELVLSQGFDVNDGGKFGITPLHLASFTNMLEIVKILIARGANVKSRDIVTKSTPLHFVSRKETNLSFIVDTSAVKQLLCWQVFYKDKRYTQKIMVLLIKNGVNVNSTDSLGRTVLHLETTLKKARVIKYRNRVMPDSDIVNYYTISELLKCGAYMDVEDDKGNLPLHNALKTGHEKALKTLLDFDVDVNEPDTCSIVLESEEKLKNLVIMHVLKLNAIDLPVSSTYIPHMTMSNPVLRTQCVQCSGEVVKLKTHVLDNCKVTFYDLLHMNWKQQINYAPRVPVDLKKKFPLYHGIIQNRCQEALQRKSLLDSAKLAWYEITNINLPDICVERILHYLKNKYLRVLVNTASNGQIE